MKIYIGADHNGFEYKAKLVTYLKRSGYEVVDEGGDGQNPQDDYPQFAGRVIHAMRGDAEPVTRGMLICGSGQGMCMTANRFKGIRAALCWDQEEAHSARNDDDSNVLCLSARDIDFDKTIAIVQTWLMTPFAGAPRFKRRIQEMDELT
jgi:ribose 5-phosphate isomerase B